MTPLAAAVGKYLLDRVIEWWDRVRPLSKEKRQARQDRRDLKRKLKSQGLSRKERKMKLLEILAQMSAAKRTSTKSGAAGVAVTGVGAVLALWPFYDTIKAFIANVCAQPDPTDFIVAAVVGSAVTGVSMFLAARASKTPANPGAL